MTPLKVVPVTSPRSHRTTSITAMVHNMWLTLFRSIDAPGREETRSMWTLSGALGRRPAELDLVCLWILDGGSETFP